ncbi:MAG: GNAT family N-acetyltransferase [Bacteroidia bacterium]|nr:GNAT family N-acetyltransferase [Bacteroidia bacterium]NNM23312.1 GNAT family N-acetyltransferase [Flavobacteriaceae bacterium]
MKIERANSSHLSDLVLLFDAYRVFYKQPSNFEAARKFLAERMLKEDSVVFMAVGDDGQALGFTQLYPSFSSVSLQNTFILNDLFVHPSARNQGVGQALMEHAKEFARDTGGKGLTLETAVDNPAQRLYKRLGWKKDVDVNHYTWKA